MSSTLATMPRAWMRAQTVAAEEARYQRRLAQTARRRRDDTRLGLTALAVALLVLPGAPIRQSPEFSATLAVSAICLLAGQRWAIALIVLCELLLLPNVVPRAFAGMPTLPTASLAPTNLAAAAQLAALGSLALMVPALRSSRRAAAALVVITGVRRSRMSCRAAHAAVWASAIAFALVAT